MTQAAEQCRSFVEAEFPGVRISRRSCRDTDAGGISQHSAYQPGDYDSNALDIMGGPHGWTWDQNVALIQEIVDRLTPKLHEWSIRKILWQVPPHYGHAHIDFYPMIDIHRWCSTRNVEPPWKYSDGHTERHLDPEPENGEYHGEDTMPKQQWDAMIRSLFAGRPDKFGGDPQYWIDLDPDDSQWETHFWPAFVDAISLEGGTP